MKLWEEEGEDLTCYPILRCVVCSSSPIYNSLREDERGTVWLARLRPAGETARASLSENHAQEPTLVFVEVYSEKLDKRLVSIGKSLFLAQFTSIYLSLFTLTEVSYFPSCERR